MTTLAPINNCSSYLKVFTDFYFFIHHLATFEQPHSLSMLWCSDETPCCVVLVAHKVAVCQCDVAMADATTLAHCGGRQQSQ